MSERPSAGLACALGAYLAWGFLPVYWKQVKHVAAAEVLSHRVVWSLGFLTLILTLTRRWSLVAAVLKDARQRALMLASTALISTNWGLYIWAVNSNHVTDGSLGYYINPILNVLVGRLVLGEPLRPLAVVALVAASAGVAVMAVGLGTLPWIALVLALTFSLYGLVRKQAGVDPLTGLTIEVALGAPLALAFLATRPLPASSDLPWLAGAGVVTAIPLLLFAAGVTRLRFSTMGILQYIAPTCQLGLAVLRYGEPFERTHAITFGLVWTGVLLYAIDALRAALGKKEAH